MPGSAGGAAVVDGGPLPSPRASLLGSATRESERRQHGGVVEHLQGTYPTRHPAGAPWARLRGLCVLTHMRPRCPAVRNGVSWVSHHSRESPPMRHVRAPAPVPEDTKGPHAVRPAPPGPDLAGSSCRVPPPSAWAAGRARPLSSGSPPWVPLSASSGLTSRLRSLFSCAPCTADVTFPGTVPRRGDAAEDLPRGALTNTGCHRTGWSSGRGRARHPGRTRETPGRRLPWGPVTRGRRSSS